MIENSTTRLCSYCANSIDEAAEKCAYCKADLTSEFTPQWLSRNEPSTGPRVGARNPKRFPVSAKYLWPGAILVAALGGFLAGGYAERKALMPATETESKQLQAKDQMIRSQEAQLTELRQQLNASANQIAELKNKLEENPKNVPATSSGAVSGAGRLEAKQPTRRTAARASAPAAPRPQPSTRRPGRTGVYETTQETAVYENPTPSSRILSQIGAGTRINVVNVSGDWLEVRSKYGNPPGYVLASDTRPVRDAN
jgi:hypothetical protein